jgi:hypothetical protein
MLSRESIIFEEVFAEQEQFPDTLTVNLGEDWLYGSGAEDWNTDSGAEDWNLIADMYMPAVMSMRQDVHQIRWYNTIREFQGLDAWIDVGLFRYADRAFPGQEYPDEMAQVTDLVLGSNRTGGLADVLEDWNTIADLLFDEDWNLLATAEDWGEGNPSSSSWDTEVIATNDGTEVFNTVTPTLSRTLETQRHYTLNSSGMYHKVHMSASDVGQSFHLKILEVAGSMDGRL